MAELSATAERIIAMLPLHYGGIEDPDPFVARWAEALGTECNFVRELLEAIRATTIPINADDTVGALARWEATLGLPVAPEGVSVSRRRSDVMGRLRARRLLTGASWRAALDQVIASATWDVEGNTPTPHTLRVTLPFAPGSYVAGRIEEYVRRAAPANQLIVFQYDAGFIVGIGRVNVDAI